MKQYLKNSLTSEFVKILTSDDGIGKALTVSNHPRFINIMVKWYDEKDFKYYEAIEKQEFEEMYQNTIETLNNELQSNHIEFLEEELEKEIGVSFLKFAEEHITPILNQEFSKNELLAKLRMTTEPLAQITAHSFKLRLKLWCKLKGFAFQDRIIKGVSYNSKFHKSVEFLKISTGVTELHLDVH